MALKNTITSIYVPGYGKYNDVTAQRGTFIQTTTALTGATAASLKIFQSATAAKLGCGVNAFHLVSLVVSVTLPSTTSEVSAYLGTSQLFQMVTAGSGVVSLHFGDHGIVGPDVTTTSTVSIVSAVGGATLKATAIGYYET